MACLIRSVSDIVSLNESLEWIVLLNAKLWMGLCVASCKLLVGIRKSVEAYAEPSGTSALIL